MVFIFTPSLFEWKRETAMDCIKNKKKILTYGSSGPREVGAEPVKDLRVHCGAGDVVMVSRSTVGTLAAVIVILILGLGLGLGLDLQRCKDKVVPQTSCRNRCFQPLDGTFGCRCDSSCADTNSCCFDYQDICIEPAHQWECTRPRCGEKRLTESKCHCSDDCLSAGDCCTNYKHVCHGEKEWVEDDCEDLSVATCPPGVERQPLLLISLDGLRAEYMQTWNTLIPVLDKLRSCGTSASYMQPAFPSKTFPNHYTVVTGLYPESNGLIDNTMFDPVLNATFSLSSPEKNNPAWYLGQPVWLTAMNNGLKSGTFFWPGSDVEINGSFPNIYMPYNGNIPFEERVFTLLKWMQLPNNERPDFYTLYLEEPDKSGHNYGPVSGGVISSLQKVDEIIRQLMNGIKQIDVLASKDAKKFYISGMEETSCSRKEAMQDLVGSVREYFVTEGPFGRVRPRNDDAPLNSTELVAKMTCKKPDQKIKAYLKANLPKRLHFANSRRIEDVNVLVEPKWLFERYTGSLAFCSGGNHGYDNDVESMHAMFLSYGPKFNYKTEIEPFSNIELYNLMCDVLQIPPADNNGTHGSMNHALRKPYFTPVHPTEQSKPAQCPLVSLDPPNNLGCSCPGLDGNAINNRLNLSAEETSAAEKKHMLFGHPQMLQPGQSYCILYQEGYVSSYSNNMLMPLWSSYTLKKPFDLEPLPPILPNCLRADVRLAVTQSPTCDDYKTAGNLTYSFLYPPNLNFTADQQYDALIMSNVVPMYPAFKKIWEYFHNTLLKKYASLYNGINVVSGPVFDYNYNGRYDTPEQIKQFVPNTNISVPTHYFVVLTSCKSSEAIDACKDELQTLSFLLPHRDDTTESCKSTQEETEWVEDLIWFHQARVKDVEWITGLDFYQGSTRPLSELLMMKTRPTAAIQRKQS